MIARVILIAAIITLFPGNVLRAQEPELIAEMNTGVTTYQIVWSPDGALIAAANDNGALILDQNLAVLTSLQGHDGNVTASVAWHPDGSQLATGGGETDNTVRVWNRDIANNSFAFNRSLETGVEATPMLAWSPNGQKLASLSMSPVSTGLIAHLNIRSTTGNWDPLPKPEYMYLNPLFALTWSFDSQFLALAGRLLCIVSETSTCVETSEGEGTVVIDTLIGDITYVNDNFPPPFSLAWSPVDLQLASTSFTAVEVYNGTTGTFIRSLPHALVQLAWSPDGTTLAGGFGDEVIILDINSGGIIQTIPFLETRSIQWSPDGSKIAVANLDGIIQIWQIAEETFIPVPTTIPSTSRKCGI